MEFSQMFTNHVINRIVCILLFYTIQGITSTCPEDAAAQAKNCVKGLGLGQLKAGPPNEFIQDGDGVKALAACRNGDLLDAVSCMERVQDKCKNDNSESAHFLRQMIDVERARHALTYFCTNVKTYVENADCISSHHQENKKCAAKVFSSYKTQSRAINNMDSRMRFQCSFFNTAVNCTQYVLTRKCGLDVAEIVTTVMKGLEPPTCFNHRTAVAKATNTGASYDIQPIGGDINTGGGNSAVLISCHVYVTLISMLFTVLCCIIP